MRLKLMMNKYKLYLTNSFKRDYKKLSNVVMILS